MKSLFLEDGIGCTKWCVRRVLGTVGFLSCVVAMFVGVDHLVLNHVLYASTILLGITTIDKFKK